MFTIFALAEVGCLGGAPRGPAVGVFGPDRLQPFVPDLKAGGVLKPVYRLVHLVNPQF